MITTTEEPILRVSRAYGFPVRIEAIAVNDIDYDFPENAFTEDVVNALVAGKQYDDSDDYKYLCLYWTDRPEQVRKQWNALLEEYPEYLQKEE
jgi:hypothetical protein